MDDLETAVAQHPEAAAIILAALKHRIENGAMAGAEQMVEMEGSERAQIAVDAYLNVIDIIDAALGD